MSGKKLATFLTIDRHYGKIYLNTVLIYFLAEDKEDKFRLGAIVFDDDPDKDVKVNDCGSD